MNLRDGGLVHFERLRRLCGRLSRREEEDDSELPNHGGIILRPFIL